MSTNIEFTPPTGVVEPVNTGAAKDDAFERLMVLDYVRKPLYVKAVRVTESNMPRVAEWCGGKIEESPRGDKFIRIAAFQPHNERQSKAIIGDWVTMTENESVKSYTNKAFKRIFDLFKGEEVEAAVEVAGTVDTKVTGNDETDLEGVFLHLMAKRLRDQ